MIGFVWGAGIATPNTKVHIHTHTHTRTHARTHQHICILHSPTLAVELATHIRTDRTPRTVQTTSGHPIKVFHTTPSPNPQQRSDQTHCHPHMTAGHHKIRYAPSPPTLTTYPPKPIWTKHLHMTNRFTLETRSLIASHLSK